MKKKKMRNSTPPPFIMAQDDGYEFFSSGYGPLSLKLFIVKNVNNSRKTISVEKWNMVCEICPKR